MSKVCKTLASVLVSGLAATLVSCGARSGEAQRHVAKDTVTSTAAPAKPVTVPEAKGTRRILFIGNSHTEFYVSLPKMFGELCDFNQVDMEESTIVEMGISLEDIYRGSRDAIAKASSRNDPDGNYYDYIVLQEKTPVAAQDPQAYGESVKKFLADLKKNSPGAVALIYEVMSPLDYDREKGDYMQWADEMGRNAAAVTDASPNAKLYRLSAAITAAYRGDNGYRHAEGGKDRLRMGTNTLHMMNDAGFLAATLLYATIFGKAPAIPPQMSFSKGADAEGQPAGQRLQAVREAVSDPDALLKIAMAHK